MTIHPGGLFAYVANENSNDVSTFRIDPASGELSQVGVAVAAGDGPRSITLDSTGRFAYVANFESDSLLRFAIDPLSGALSQTGEAVATGAGPHSIAIIGGSN